MHQLTDKTGAVAGMMICSPDSGVFLITSEGTMIRTELSSVRICGRSSQGVIVMRTQEGERVISLAAAPREDDEEAVEENEENSGAPEEEISENQTEIDKIGDETNE